MKVGVAPFPITFRESLKEFVFLGVPGWPSQFSVRLLISAQVMISQFVIWRPKLGSTLTVQSLLRILSLPLSLFAPSFLILLSLSK